jgi:exonuclease SbcD
MKLVHLSDLHLGFRGYTRTTAAGINQREHDVFTTFRATVDRIIAIAPDLVVIGGDVFHSVRPPNSAILGAFREFGRLVHALPRTIVVLVAGNHDMPKTSDAGCILQLFASLGIHVVDTAPRRLDFPDRNLSVLGVPDAPGIVRPELRPDRFAQYKVLVLHGEVAGMLKGSGAHTDRPSVEISREELGAEQWDYVALGHYHVYRELAPNCYYSGSIDYTSSNPWGERLEEQKAGLAGKVIVERNLATGVHTVHPLTPARPLTDLPAIDCSGMAPADVDAAIRAALEACPGGIDDAIVRLVVHGVPREATRELDQKAIRDYKRRATHLALDIRRPDVVRLGDVIGPAVMQAHREGRSLDSVVLERLDGREVGPGVDRAELRALAASYLEFARDKVRDEVRSIEPLTDARTEAKAS